MRKKEAKLLMMEANAFLKDLKPNDIEQAELDSIKLYLIDGKTLLARVEDILFPTLASPNLDAIPDVIVDMGAIPYITNGADVMAPGIVCINGDFDQGNLIVLRDERHSKAIAIGRALTSAKKMKEVEKGKVIQNLHYVGDLLWKSLSF